MVKAVQEEVRKMPEPATGFIYVVKTVQKDYTQPSLRCVPNWSGDRLYFGPCKVPMRPKMKEGDYIFGLSPSETFPRRIVFAARIARKMTFADAYETYPGLRGPEGPIHVRPTTSPGLGFPWSHYEHIPSANHEGEWDKDLRSPDLDAFFVCEPAAEILGRWLGEEGPAITEEILEFLRGCSVHGASGPLGMNSAAKHSAPVAYGQLYKGLHLETDDPKALLNLMVTTMSSRTVNEERPLRSRT